MIVEQIFFSFANLPMLSPGLQQASIISVLLSNFGLQEGWFNCAKRYPVFGLLLELNLVTFSNLKTWHCGCFNFYFCFLAIFFSEALKTCDWKYFLLTYLRNPKIAKNQNVLCCSRACEVILLNFFSLFQCHLSMYNWGCFFHYSIIRVMTYDL